MQKEFEVWSRVKKNLHTRAKNPLYHTREIWWAHVGLNIGFEQDGTGELFKRPVLVLRGLSRYVCLIVPLTTSAKRDSFYIDIGLVNGKEAAAIISQIKLIDTRRLVEKVGMLDVRIFEDIRKKTKELL